MSTEQYSTNSNCDLLLFSCRSLVVIFFSFLRSKSFEKIKAKCRNFLVKVSQMPRVPQFGKHCYRGCTRKILTIPVFLNLCNPLWTCSSYSLSDFRKYQLIFRKSFRKYLLGSWIGCWLFWATNILVRVTIIVSLVVVTTEYLSEYWVQYCWNWYTRM